MLKMIHVIPIQYDFNNIRCNCRIHTVTWIKVESIQPPPCLWEKEYSGLTWPAELSHYQGASTQDKHKQHYLPYRGARHYS